MTEQRVQIIYFKAGGGHVSAKNALIEALYKNHPDWNVQAVNLYDLLAPIDPISNLTKDVSESETLGEFLSKISKRILKKEDFEFKPFSIEDVYNYALKKGITLGMSMSLPILQAFIKYKSPQIQELLQQHWRGAAPDMVISVIPNFNREIGMSLKAVHPDVPFVTLMTDLVDLKSRFGFWMAQQDQYLICGTPEAYAQALTLGCYDQRKVTRVSGMILRQSFYESPQDPITHAHIGLDPNKPTAAIMFGGNGSAVSADIAACLHEAKLGVQTIVLCGNNHGLYRKLQQLVERGEIAECYPVGYTDKVAQFFGLSHIVIGKPGPGSISEAMQMGCIMLTASKGVMPQEIFNLSFLEKHGIGRVIESFEPEEVVAAVKTLLDGLRGPQSFRQNIAAFPGNHAATDIVAALEKIIENHPVFMGETEDIADATEQGWETRLRRKLRRIG